MVPGVQSLRILQVSRSMRPVHVLAIRVHAIDRAGRAARSPRGRDAPCCASPDDDGEPDGSPRRLTVLSGCSFEERHARPPRDRPSASRSSVGSTRCSSCRRWARSADRNRRTRRGARAQLDELACWVDVRTRAGPASPSRRTPGSDAPRSRSSLHRRRSPPSSADRARARPCGFLLIVRTGRIVTAHASPSHEGVTRWTSTAGYSGVPAYSQVL